MKNIFIFIIISILSHTGFSQDSATQKLDEIVNAYARLGRFNGSVLVAKHGNIILQKGYGVKNADNHALNDANTIYQIASVTKQFTATVILKLVELKKMSLNDKLDQYYTDFANGDSITIENLLTHTSGLHNFTEGDSGIAETDEKRMVPYLKSLKPDFAPGTDWHYSNSGYVMLGYIIQKASGMSYWQAVRKYIFQPLHMNSSGFDFTHLVSNERAVGYSVLTDSVKERATITDSTVPFGAGAIYSTVEDMYKWHRGLQAYKIVGKDLTYRSYTPCDKHNYGYGWQIDSIYNRKMVSHSGSISGFGSNFARITDDDVCIVLLSNKGGSTVDLMHITDKLLAILYNQPYSVPVRRTAVPVGEEVLKKYAGTYEIANPHLVIDMMVDNGQLIAQPHHGPTTVMCAINEKEFYLKQDEETEIKFEMDGSGEVLGVIITQVGIKRTAKKIK